MAILFYHHHKQIRSSKLDWVLAQDPSVHSDRQSFRYDWHLCLRHKVHSDKRAHKNARQHSRGMGCMEAGQLLGNQKFHRCVFHYHQQLLFLQKLKPWGNKAPKDQDLLDLRSSSSGTETITENSLVSIFFGEMQPPLPTRPAHDEHLIWLPSFGPFSSLIREVLPLASLPRWENSPS